MSHVPIQDRFLDNRDLFALRYNQGLVFLEVEEFEDTEYEDFSNLEDIESGTSLNGGYQRIEDSNNDDLLFVPETDKFIVMHVGIGLSPSVIEMFISYPEGTRNRGSLPDLTTQPTPGASFGMIDGGQSPYRQPTSAAELVLPPKQRVSMDFNNPGDDAHEPILKIVYRKYRVAVLDPEDGVNKNNISRIVGPGSPAPIFPVGNISTKADFDLDEEWGVNPVTKKDARKMLKGGGRR